MPLVSKLLWGTGLENELRIGYPLFDIVTDREERDGSEHIQGPGGAEDSWITGRDYTMDAEVRWIPDGPLTSPVQTQLSGAVSWQEFLDWARDANAFRFVPDENVPDFYVDNTYLVEPRKGFGSLSGDIKRNVRLKLRNPVKDFHEALRGVVFEYAAGGKLTDPLLATFSRAMAAARRGKPSSAMAAAIGASDLSNVLRDRHYEGVLRTALLEASRAQLVPNPENFGAWSVQGTVGRTSGQPDPFGGTGAYLLDSNAPAVSDAIFDVVAFTGDGNKGILVFARQGSAATSDVLLFDFTASVERCRIRITWASGVPTLSVQNGAGTPYAAIPFGGGLYAIPFTANSIVAANTNRLLLYPDPSGGGGTTYFFGANAWNEFYPGSYQAPGLTPRPYDKLLFPVTIRPQGLAIYLALVERGLRFGAGNGVNSTVALQIGDSPNRLTVEGGNAGSGPYTFSRFFTAGNNSSTTAVGSDGQLVELLGLLRPTGTVQIIKRLDGGAEAAGAESGGVALPDSFGSGLIHLGGINGVSNGGFVPLVRAKVLAYAFAGVNRDTVAKAAAV